MFPAPSRRRPLVAPCLTLSLALASPATSLAQKPGAARPTAPATDASASAVDSAQAPHLRLALFDTTGLPDTVRDRALTRVQQIFGQVDVVIEWYEPSSTSNAEDPAEPYYLKIILFDRPAAAMGQPPDAMGVSFHTDLVPDAVWLFDPVIRRALQRPGRRARPLSAEELGRAYGRVIAHEVIHAVANDMRHAETGVMAPTQNRKLLLSSSAALDTESEAAFLMGLARIQLSLMSVRD